MAMGGMRVCMVESVRLTANGALMVENKFLAGLKVNDNMMITSFDD